MASRGPDRRRRVRRGLGKIARDRTQGASRLARRALDVLSDAWEPRRGSPGGASSRDLRAAAAGLARTQPAMGPFLRWARDLDDLARLKSDPARARALARWLRSETSLLEREGARIAAVTRRRLPPAARVVTLSRSATVAKALASMPRRRRPREVVVLESRPGAEGRAMAADLARLGLVARWVPDREGPERAAGADLVLLGADAVGVDGSIVP
jgi:ribose 1,5-bisphosphate isomerase